MGTFFIAVFMAAGLAVYLLSIRWQGQDERRGDSKPRGQGGSRESG